MDIGQILSYSLIGIGLLAIIIALVYTKIIKPSSFGYTSKSFLVKRKIKRVLNDLIKSNKLISGYDNVLFDSIELELAILDMIYFGPDHIYLISNPIYWNIKEVKDIKSKTIMLSKKNKELDLPLDVNVFIKAVKPFKKMFEIKQEVIVLIPCLNKNFSDIVINNVYFIKVEKIKSFISEQEFSEHNNLELLQNKIINKMKKRKSKRRLFPKFEKKLI